MNKWRSTSLVVFTFKHEMVVVVKIRYENIIISSRRGVNIILWIFVRFEKTFIRNKPDVNKIRWILHLPLDLHLPRDTTLAVSVCRRCEELSYCLMVSDVSRLEPELSHYQVKICFYSVGCTGGGRGQTWLHCQNYNNNYWSDSTNFSCCSSPQ